jgi:hypothetical protein
MRKRRLQQAWKNTLTIVALIASLLALYLQVFERRARQEEARLAAVRLDDALAASRTRLRAEILAALRAELSDESPPAQTGREPLPDTVLRRLEAGGAGGALEQALGPTASREALLTRFNGALESLAHQMEEADRALRRDLEELRAATLREADVASKTLALVLVALVCLVARVLPELWPRGGAVLEVEGDELQLRASSSPRSPESGPAVATALPESRKGA